MPTLAALLKEEISKIARKEVQDQVRDLNKTVREQRDAIARLEKQLGSAKAKAAAKPAAKPAAKSAAKPAAKPAAAKPAAAKPAAKPAAKASKASTGDKRKQPRIAPDTIKKHRKRLKLSQAELGKLLNVSTNTVLRWEAGSSKPRGKHLPELAKLRSISQRELKNQLGE